MISPERQKMQREIFRRRRGAEASFATRLDAGGNATRKISAEYHGHAISALMPPFARGDDMTY